MQSIKKGLMKSVRRGVVSRWCALAMIAAWLTPLHAVSSESSALLGAAQTPVRVALVADRQAVQPGVPFQLGVKISHAAGWHTYWRNPGEAGLATHIVPEGPEGTQWGHIQWPVPKRLLEGGLGIYGYDGDRLLPWSVVIPAKGSGSDVALTVAVQWLACRDVCIPGEARLALTLPIAPPEHEGSVSGPHAAAFAADVAQRPRVQPGLEPRWHTQGLALGQATLTGKVPPGLTPPSHVEFFPYEEGVLQAAAVQRVFHTDEGWRLDLAAAGSVPRTGSIAGVLVLGDRVYEITADSVLDPPPQGVLVAEVPAMVTRPEATSSVLSVWSERDAVAVSSVQWDGGAWVAIGLAGLGGLLLNFMPCVFPVIGLKILGFAQARDAPNAARALRRGGGAFALGVMLSFAVLGALWLGLRATGQAVGWGFQLQSPAFVLAMAVLFFVLGLNFSGVIEWGYGLTRLAGHGVSGHSLWGALGSGCLAVVVATPCTAPFMGAALGFALVQPAPVAMAVLMAMGAGMALPYVALSWWPGSVRWLPRPGSWMLTLRQFLAFPMYASAAWLVWVLVQQLGGDAVLRVLWIGVMIALAAWFWGPPQGLPRPRWRRLAAALAMIGALWLGQSVLATPEVASVREGGRAGRSSSADSPAQGPVDWLPWSPERVAQARAAGRWVLIDFTAAWCVTCQINKLLVLQRDEVNRALLDRRVVTLRADWTHRDPAITRELARHGRSGVPLYVVYRPNAAAALILPDVLTVAAVLAAVSDSH
jgi:thiol:disulfide interchange protein/DsbC/DsbD-like thiol-disulfide interchange protein